MKAAAQEAGSLRTCVATRAELPPDEMIRFVLAPDGTVTPDLRRKLPGRGVWVTATAQAVAAAAKKNAFARSFKTPARVPDGLADRIEELMARDCLQALALANKAGLVTTGFAKVEAQVEKGEVVALLHAADGGADGKRKLGQALRRRFGGAPPIELEAFGSAQMDLALGRSNVIHAALRSGPASAALIERCARLRKYRAGAGELDCANAPSGRDEGA
ncbi:MAG: RNA-binding protein [Hyphomicrobiales bacterium]|nr:RNA-binding protein [Hyphomicrobiales bacterium]